MSEPNSKSNKPDESQTESEGQNLEVEKSEEKQSESNESKPTLWLPEASWATSWVNSAKEKTKSTIETMKKDIHEISDTLQHGASSLANVTVKQVQTIGQFIAPTPDTNEEKIQQEQKEMEKEAEIENTDADTKKSVTGNIFGFNWMKQMVDTVQKFATEDTTKDEEQNTEELHIGPGGRKTILDQNDRRTFLQPPQQNVDLYNDWLTGFKIGEYNGEINLLLGYNPRLRELYAELVPSQIDNHTFWNRYFFKVHLKELDKQLSHQEAPKLNLEKIGSSSSGGHSPAPSNGKDDWSMCSSGVTTEAEELDAEVELRPGRDEVSTPKPPTSKDEEDDWEECEGDAENDENLKEK